MQYSAAMAESVKRRRGDVYHRMITTPWPRLIVYVAAYYLVVNALFAVAYWLQDGSVSNTRPGSLVDAFFFSVQTFSTVGYGGMAPQTLYANVLVTIESFAGLMSVALITGLVIGKFARPSARVVFSKVAVVGLRDGRRSLMVRMANERSNLIVEATVRVTVLFDEKTPEGEDIRRMHDLELARGNTPAFSLTFTAVHPIDEKSPLHGMDAAKLEAVGARIIVSITGTDEVFAQTVHARHAYAAKDVVFGGRFVDMLTTRDGEAIVALEKISEWTPERAAG